MKHLLKRIKRKGSPPPPQQPGSLAEPASDISARPPSPLADQVIPGDGARSHSYYQDLEVDYPDLAIPLDERGGDGAEAGEEPPASETRTSSAVIGGTGHRDEPTIESTGDMGGEIGPAELSGVMKRAREGILLGGPNEDTERFGPLKAVLGNISALYANRDGTITVGNKIENLLSHVVVVEESFNSRPSDVAEQRRREEVILEFTGIGEQLRSLSEKLGLHQLTDQVQDDEEMFRLLEDLQEAIFRYRRVRQTMINDERLRLMDPGQISFHLHVSSDSCLKDSPLVAEAAVLNTFRYAQQAEYRHGNRNGCLKGTRRAVLDGIELWIRDFGEPPVYWLNGLAGTGKSTIAQTVAERMFADGRLGASFFCSRDFEDRSNLHFIFPTLAVQLARRYPEFRSIFIPLVQSDPEISHESLYGQMNRLVVQPLITSSISTVIVIDALDECKDEEPASAILSVLGQFVASLPMVKFFVTGRPESRIQEGFRLPLLAEATDVFVLHDVEPSQVSNDIRLFFRQSFEELKGRRPGLDGWPTEEQRDVLCKRAAGLFVYAVATVRFIYQRNTSPKRQLDRLLQSPESNEFEGKTKFKGDATLDSLYASILQEAFGDDDPENDPRVRSTLGAVILAANPLSPSTIAALLCLDVEDVFPLLSSVQSLLIFQVDDLDRPVRPFHKSFPDFIVDPVRCANPRFRVNTVYQNVELLVGCLELMNQRLGQNICRLPDGVTNSEVDDLGERIEKHIDQALQYACRSWHKHLIGTLSAQALDVTPILHHFLKKKFLFWLEVLSVLGATREAVDALDAAGKWLCVSPTLDLVRDYFRFVTAFFEVINTSAPHIYHSALPLSPQKSIVHTLYEHYARPFARVVQGLPISWEAPDLITKYDFGFCENVAWSPGSNFVVVATLGAVSVLDATTLRQLSTFGSPFPEPKWLSVSPDGRLLLAFHRGDIVVWDLQTGCPVATILTGPDLPSTSRHLSSAHSLDGKAVFVAYGEGLRGSDAFFTAYELRSGTHTTCRIPGGRIVTPIWTHGNSHLRFATVARGSLTIWEVTSTLTQAPIEVESLPAPDEVIDGDHLLFLPALSRLAFSLRNEVLVWDTRTSKLLLKSGLVGDQTHTSAGFGNGSFSSDGRFFACGTNLRYLYVWKESSAGYVLHQELAFTGATGDNMPFLSPNGESIIFLAGARLHLWSTKDQTPLHSNFIIKDMFDFIIRNMDNFIREISPGETLVAFARRQGERVTVLDLQSGDLRLVIDAGMPVECLGITEDTVVVVGTEAIVTWNMPTGNFALDAWVNIDDSVRTTMFDPPPLPYDWDVRPRASISPDLSRIAFIGHSHERKAASLGIYNMSNDGRLVGCTTVPDEELEPRFTPDGREVWVLRGGDAEKGWKIIEDRGSATTRLEPLPGPTTCQPGTLPWQSLCGYKITDDGWVLNSTRKRLLWLPHHWRSYEEDGAWSGRFLGLGNRELPAPVILEFFE